MLNKKLLSKRDIYTQFITPALEQARWDTHTSFCEEAYFPVGKIYVCGKLAADCIHCYKPDISITIIETNTQQICTLAGARYAAAGGDEWRVAGGGVK